MKLKKLPFIPFCLFVFFGATTQAVELQVSITNLTQGMSFTPRLLVAHNEDIDLFSPGTTATTALAWLAEAGVIQDGDDANSAGDNFEAYLNSTDNANTNTWQAFSGLVGPATTSSVYSFDAQDYPYLSLLTMLIPTNDAFAGLDSLEIPTTPGTYTYRINAYDAGTELNDEINPVSANGAGITEAGTGNALGGYGVPGIAGAPTSTAVGTSGTGVSAQIDGSNQVADGTDGPVHIHRNVLGDTNATAGISDLDASVHRWLNPVALITITVPTN